MKDFSRWLLLCGLALMPLGAFAQGAADAPAQAAEWAAKGDTAARALDFAASMDDYRRATAPDPAKLEYVIHLAGVYAAVAGLRDSETSAVLAGFSPAHIYPTRPGSPIRPLR